MRSTLITSLFAVACLTVSATAQKVQIFGDKDGTRAATTQILFGDIVGGISIEYGQPTWKASHDEMRDQLKGKVLRLGKDWWTTMTTNFALEIGDTKVPAGSYLLGLNCDQEGNFGLTFLESTKGLKAGALPFAMGQDRTTMNWKPDFIAPLIMKENANSTAVEKMKMTLDISGETLDGSYTLAWGPHQLCAKVVVKVGAKSKASDAGHDKKGEHGKKGEHK